MRLTTAALLVVLALPAAAQDWVAGVEATSGATFSYLTHYSRRGDFTLWQSISLLTYRVREGGSEVRVNSPGVSTGVSRRWNTRATSFGLGTGYEFRWTERTGASRDDFRETEHGVIVDGDVARRFTTRTSGRLAARWSGANDWTAASADAGYTIARGVRIGPQVIWQGNQDFRVVSTGALVEIPVGGDTSRSALQFRAGQARVEHADGSTDSEPYFSAGIVVPFR